MTASSSDLNASGISYYTFSTNGTRIHYRRAGKGPEVVVCLHGFPQTGRSWERLAARLADRFTISAPDLRGAGESQRTMATIRAETSYRKQKKAIAPIGSGELDQHRSDVPAIAGPPYSSARSR